MGTIRLLLALAVLIIMHSDPPHGLHMIGGAAAVQGFYVISGFYMALVLNEKYPRGVRDRSVASAHARAKTAIGGADGTGAVLIEAASSVPLSH